MDQTWVNLLHQKTLLDVIGDKTWIMKVVCMLDIARNQDPAML